MLVRHVSPFLGAIYRFFNLKILVPVEHIAKFFNRPTRQFKLYNETKIYTANFWRSVGIVTKLTVVKGTDSQHFIPMGFFVKQFPWVH
jgi:hypothetical protein